MAKLSSGLASCRPLITRLIHVLLTPIAFAISILEPRGLVLKNSSSVIYSPLFGLRLSYTKKIYVQGGCILNLNLLHSQHINSEGERSAYKERTLHNQYWYKDWLDVRTQAAVFY
jgi:hypothetical protein